MILSFRKRTEWTSKAVATFIVAIVCGLTACTRSLDMSHERITEPGTQWGIVIGSALVQLQKPSSGPSATGRDLSDEPFEFEVVQTQPGDPDGESPYAERYRLDAKTGEERIFISRLRSGQYLIRNFHKSGMMGIGGELNLAFASMAGETRYIGRVLVEIPQRVSKGKGYRFTIENARERTLAQVSKTHPELTGEVVDVPLQARQQEEP